MVRDIKDGLTIRLEKWGYCIIEEALSKKQLACMQKRTEEQAAGERFQQK